MQTLLLHPLKFSFLKPLMHSWLPILQMKGKYVHISAMTVHFFFKRLADLPFICGICFNSESSAMPVGHIFFDRQLYVNRDNYLTAFRNPEKTARAN